MTTMTTVQMPKGLNCTWIHANEQERRAQRITWDDVYDGRTAFQRDTGEIWKAFSPNGRPGCSAWTLVGTVKIEEERR
jgi:hypothetical protein